MKLSIITPSYNQEKYIERTIKSVVTQKGINTEYELEYIIIDGASTDNSVDIIKKYANKYKFIRWISKKDKGQSDALDKGFNWATGDVIAWINSDDEYTKGTFSLVVKQFKKKSINWVTGYATIVDENNAEILKNVTRYKNMLSQLPSWMLFTENFISQPSTFMRRSTYNKLGGIHKSLYYCMDYDLWLRFLQASKPVIIRKPLSLFRRYDESKSGLGYSKQFAEQYTIAKKYTKNPLLLGLHKLLNVKTVLAYKYM